MRTTTNINSQAQSGKKKIMIVKATHNQIQITNFQILKHEIEDASE